MSIPSEFTSPADLATAGLMDGTKWNAFRNWLQRTQPASATISKEGSAAYGYRANGVLVSSSSTSIGAVIESIIAAIGTGSIHIRNGTYPNLDIVDIPTDICLIGESRTKTIIQSGAAVASTPFVNSDTTNGNTGIKLASFTIDHLAASTGACVNFTRVDSSIWHNMKFKDGKTFTAYWTGSTDEANDNILSFNEFRNTVGGSGDQFGGGKLTDSFVIGNRFIGVNDGAASGACVQRLPKNTVFANNIAYGNIGSGIALETGIRCSVVGNISHDNFGTGISITTSADGDPSDCVISDNVIYTNGTQSNTGRGVSCAGSRHTITGNRINASSGPGIEITGNDNTVKGNILTNNGIRTSIADNFRVGIRITNGLDNIVQGNRCFDDQGTKTQKYGIAEVGTADFNVISGNNVRGNDLLGMITAGASSQVRNNIGFVTEAKGTSTIVSGTTSIAVTHGLSYTPAAGEISVTFTENPTVTPGMWWPSAIGATTFTVNVENNPSTSNLDFSWNVRRI